MHAIYASCHVLGRHGARERKVTSRLKLIKVIRGHCDGSTQDIIILGPGGHNIIIHS